VSTRLQLSCLLRTPSTLRTRHAPQANNLSRAQHTYKQIYTAPKSWKRIRGAGSGWLDSKADWKKCDYSWRLNVESLSIERICWGKAMLTGSSNVFNYNNSLYLLGPGWSVKYCNQCVCVFVCLSVLLHVSKTNCPNFRKCSVHVNCGRGSVLVWRQYNTLCTSGFVDDVIFSHNGPHGAWHCTRRAAANSKQSYISNVFYFVVIYNGKKLQTSGEAWYLWLPCCVFFCLFSVTLLCIRCSFTYYHAF